jgi:hypothetical protein
MSATKTAVAAATAAKAPETKPEGKTAVLNAAKPQEARIISFEERRAIINKIAALNERWERLNQSAKDLDSLSLKEDGRQPQITIFGSEGEKWTTSNTRFISHVIKIMGEQMNERMDEVKAELEAVAI